MKKIVLSGSPLGFGLASACEHLCRGKDFFVTTGKSKNGDAKITIRTSVDIHAFSAKKLIPVMCPSDTGRIIGTRDELVLAILVFGIPQFHNYLYEFHVEENAKTGNPEPFKVHKVCQRLDNSEMWKTLGSQPDLTFELSQTRKLL